MIGPPGSSKTLLAWSLPSILLPMTTEEALEVTKIYSVGGLLSDTSLIRQRPFCSLSKATTTFRTPKKIDILGIDKVSRKDYSQVPICEIILKTT